MSQEPKPLVVHPDFDDAAADVTIISGDDSHTHFRISSSHLSRTSEFFHGMFALPLGGVPPESRIALEEGAVTLEILLKLATGLPGGLRRLLSTDDVERTLAAAEKYGMKGVEEILALYLRAPYMDWEPIRAYALASHYGWEDVATASFERVVRLPLDLTNLPSMDIQHLLRILVTRKERIHNFRQGLLSRERDAPFYAPNANNSGRCQRCSCISTLNDIAIWKKFVVAALMAYDEAPAADTLLANPEVAAESVKLELLFCSSCRRSLFSPASLTESLRKCEMYSVGSMAVI
ncbi:hypothetical protein EXIGLDRAFT_703016 [Exidia glandulosa HHB12029]|uniref:BTB domain-containing protein n=1 Tax=Exidia glandulosa HHB12029 TaxID=1314781 RepID=A0A165LA22_EXIGL|nr:hypothetical protein EXIGLDRAFT_703016 [Exidia glandulosa HHB12029]